MTSVFPTTRQSIIVAARSADAASSHRALETIANAYWKPVYKYLRLRWRAEPADAEDLTQEFFASAIERDLFARYDPDIARFRTYLRACIDALASNSRKAAARLKRGGHARFISLDFPTAERELVGASFVTGDLDELFRREWIRALFDGAVAELRARCAAAGKHAHVALFERYDLNGERTTYAELAAELGIPATQVTNFLAFARREFRSIVLESLRDQCATDAEFRGEALELLGVEIAAAES